MLPEEYNQLYTNNPAVWENKEHDRMVFHYVSKYGEPKNLLGLGCGNGHTLKVFIDQWPDVAYTGLDFSQVAVDICTENIPTAEFVCIDVMDYKPSGKFEAILLVGVAEHFDNPPEKLEYIHQKLLKSGGVLYMEVPNCMAYRSFRNKQEGFYRIELGTRQLEWHYKRETWEQIILDAGFEIVERIKGPRLHNEFIWILTR